MWVCLNKLNKKDNEIELSSYIPILFFCCGVLFSMFNSLHLIKTLRQHLSMMKNPESANGLIWLSITAVVLISGTFIASFVITWNANEQTSLKADDICRSIRVAIFLIEWILFIVVGIKLNSLLSEFFTTMFGKVGYLFSIFCKRRGYVRFRLIVGVVLMAFPLFTNSIVNIFYIALRLRIVLNTGSIKENDYYYPIFMLVYYTVTDLVPIGSLIILQHYIKMIVKYYLQLNNIIISFIQSQSKEYTLFRITFGMLLWTGYDFPTFIKA